MATFQYVVTVTTDTEDHALQVMQERVNVDEEYADPAGVAFDYHIAFDFYDSTEVK